ncbi:MAG: DUF2029 domain-containing protein [Planctomycetes bacterium]|nr:DUF2029 domain-containing protein [Planctomycetota bacterium]
MTRRQTALLVLAILAYVGALVGGGSYFSMRAERGDRELPVYVVGGERMAAGAEIYRRGADGKPFTYPPFAAVPFVPLAGASAAWQPILWFAINLHLLLGILAVLHFWAVRPSPGRAPPRLLWFWVLTLLVGGHHVASVFSNQSHDLVVAILVVLTARAWSLGSASAGVWAGAGAAIKATPLIFLGLFGARLRIAPLAALIATAAVLSLLPDWLFPRADGHSWVVAWFDVNLRGLEVGGTASADGAWNAHSYLNQSLSGAFTRLFTPPVITGDFVDETAMLVDLGPAGCKVATLASEVAVLALLVLCARRGARAVAANADRRATQRTVGFGEVAAFACGMVLLSPQSSKAHFCIWLLPAAFLADRLTRGPRDRLLWPLVIGALVLGPLMTKGIVGSGVGNFMLARGNVAVSTLLLLLATLRALWTEPTTRDSERAQP